MYILNVICLFWYMFILSLISSHIFQWIAMLLNRFQTFRVCTVCFNLTLRQNSLHHFTTPSRVLEFATHNAKMISSNLNLWQNLKTWKLLRHAWNFRLQVNNRINILRMTDRKTDRKIYAYSASKNAPAILRHCNEGRLSPGPEKNQVLNCWLMGCKSLFVAPWSVSSRNSGMVHGNPGEWNYLKLSNDPIKKISAYKHFQK